MAMENATSREMTEVKDKKEMQEKKDENEVKIKYRIRPTRYINYDVAKNSWEIEFHLPGVPKDHLKFKMLPNAYSLEATRDQALYQSNEYLPFDVDINSVKAEYNDGLLYVSGRIKDPLEDAVEIKLS